jgi:SAM-dependent methyltransferase
VDENDKKVAELAAMVRAIRERVAASYPTEGAGGLRLPDLMPAVHARDAAEGKVAAIGAVNPRPPGLVNDLAQAAKRAVARGLDWHVREQVEFNRAVLAAIDTLIETHNETNRALATLSSRLAAMEEPAREVREVTEKWSAWREEWQTKLNVTEIKFLRGIAEMQNALHQRAEQWQAKLNAAEAERLRGAAEMQNVLHQRLAELEAAFRQDTGETRALFREGLESRTEAFHAALARASEEIQTRLWTDLETVQRDTQAMIHRELRILRQRPAPSAAGASPRETRDWPPIDWMLFAEKFRGPEPAIRNSFERYVPHFRRCAGVVDLGCGRGEFLGLMRREGIAATGVDRSAASVAHCRAQGLDAVEADFFAYLDAQPDASVGGIFCAQVIEHLQPPELPRLIALCARKLRRGAPAVFETPNPECLAIFASHFYIDPTHVRPVPPALLHFYLEEAGFVEIHVDRFAPASEAWPELAQLPDEIRERFFGFLDYAISARNAS